MHEDKMKTDPELKTEIDRATLKTSRKWSLIAIAALGIIVVGALVVFPRIDFGSLAGNNQPPKRTDRAPMAASPALGPESAPVTIIEYGDFGCPSCWAWHKLGVLDDLRAKYTDQIRFIWRDYPVITLLSPKAAEAGQCAHEQGKFWEFHDVVYENDGNIAASDLETYAAAIGLDMDQFNECVTTRRYKDRVIAEREEAFDHGFNGSPFFLVNDQILIGPQSLAVFSELIDPLLTSP